MGCCCGKEEEDAGPSLEDRRRAQAEAATRRQAEQEGRGLKDPEGAKRRMEAKERAAQELEAGGGRQAGNLVAGLVASYRAHLSNLAGLEGITFQ